MKSLRTAVVRDGRAVGIDPTDTVGSIVRIDSQSIVGIVKDIDVAVLVGFCGVRKDGGSEEDKQSAQKEGRGREGGDFHGGIVFCCFLFVVVLVVRVAAGRLRFLIL